MYVIVFILFSKTFQLANILDVSGSVLETQKFDVCIDKGTYDAILLGEVDRNKLRQLYRENVSRILTAEGVFILTSGNYTRAELAEYLKPGGQNVVHSYSK